MAISLNRIILFVQDVGGLAAFYRRAFGFAVVEEIGDEWAVLRAGPCELALHKAGAAYRTGNVERSHSGGNAKLVMTVDRDVGQLRAELMAEGASMGEVRLFPGVPGRFCDGRDPEGNVFQLAEVQR